jgi:hypothetical protein
MRSTGPTSGTRQRKQVAIARHHRVRLARHGPRQERRTEGIAAVRILRRRVGNHYHPHPCKVVGQQIGLVCSVSPNFGFGGASRALLKQLWRVLNFVKGTPPVL